MSVWANIAGLLGSFSKRTGLAGSLANLFDADNWLPGGKDAAFTIALIALAAKMAMADGAVTSSEIRAFNQMIVVPASAQADVKRLFDLARQDVAGYQAYARKIGRIFGDSPQTLEHILDGLFHIASADGLVHEAELDYLRSVSGFFGLDQGRFEQLVAQHILPDDQPDPYRVLGLQFGADRDTVRKAYRELVAEHHPDRLVAKGVPAEMIELATARMASINRAYATLTLTRPRPA